MLAVIRYAALVLLFVVHTLLFSQDNLPLTSGNQFSPAPTTAAPEKLRTALDQTPDDGIRQLPLGADPENRLGWPLIKHLATDQQTFWSSPKDPGRGGAPSFAGFAALTGLLIAGDSWLSQQVPDKPTQLQRSNRLSKYSTYSLLGAAGGSFLWGNLRRNGHLSETGLLASEALANSTAETFMLRAIAGRARPFSHDAGKFFSGGNSFPSEHASAAWSVASVLAHEYPGPLTKFLAYGLASAVTVTRVTGKQHFSSDAFVGSALGWYFGRQVYRAHHNPELGGGPWGPLFERSTESTRNPANMGSPYVPLDSWIYPALERMAALGGLETGYLGLRPWTRMECARLVEEAGEHLRYGESVHGETTRLYQSLANEFAEEAARLDGGKNLAASVDSVYTRITGISGPALRDGYHFAQTIVNDYGRPYGEGFNVATGATGHAVAGPLSIFIQGEYQHAPALPSDPASVLAATAKEDGTIPFPNAAGSLSRFEIVNASLGITVHNIQFSFGREASWLGPGEAGPLLFSDNAAPITMLRIDNTAPFHFPLLSSWLGPARSEFFLGQLSGHRWVFDNDHLVGPGFDPQPFIHGDKISFKPTANLEFGMGITAMFGGPGLPFTWGNFLRSYYSHSASVAKNPGKRLSAFDFSYRVPGLRKWLSIYNDSLVVDEVSPVGSTRPTLNPGIYLAQIPKIPKLDFRAEVLRSARYKKFGPGYVYTDGRYRSGYTSDGNLLGSWIGRAGTGVQAWSTYWFSTRSCLQFGYRHLSVDRNFLAGGNLSDFRAQSEIMLRQNLAWSGAVQYERWAFPLLASEPKSNLTASFQFTFFPGWKIR